MTAEQWLVDLEANKGGDAMRKPKWNPHDVESLRRQYRIPLKKHAPVEYRGRRGQVVGTDGQYIWIQLDGEQQAIGLCHPTWEMTWFDATYNATEANNDQP